MTDPHVQAVKTNQDDCQLLRKRLLQLLPVLLLVMNKESHGGKEVTAIPIDLRRNIDRLKQYVVTVLGSVRLTNNS